MAWNPNLPKSTSKIRLLPTQATANWAAIEDGDVPHKFLQFKKQNPSPVQVSERAFLFSRQVNSRQELYWIGDTGSRVQLTSGTPTKSASGKTFLPGGLLLQWGSNTTVSDATPLTITYPTAYTTIYQVLITRSGPSGTMPNRSYTRVEDLTATNFKARSISEGGSLQSGITLSWMAIGEA